MPVYISPADIASLTQKHNAAFLLDCSGLRCPMPVIQTERKIRQLREKAADIRFLVLADDPVAKLDLPHFCRQAKLQSQLVIDAADHCVFLVTDE